MTFIQSFKLKPFKSNWARGGIRRTFTSTLTSALNTTVVSAYLLLGFTQAQTFEFSANQDTVIKQNSPDKNYGLSKRLSLSSSDDVQRILLSFDMSPLLGEVTGHDIDSAVISLTVKDNDGHWGNGKNGRLDIYPISEDIHWQSRAATWHCQQDVDLSNAYSDCNGDWDGGKFEGEAADHIDANAATWGVIQLDVTKQIKALLDKELTHSAWLLKKADEGKTGTLTFASSEGRGAPQLIIKSNITEDINASTIELVKW